MNTEFVFACKWAKTNVYRLIPFIYFVYTWKKICPSALSIFKREKKLKQYLKFVCTIRTRDGTSDLENNFRYYCTYYTKRELLSQSYKINGRWHNFWQFYYMTHFFLPMEKHWRSITQIKMSSPNYYRTAAHNATRVLLYARRYEGLLSNCQAWNNYWHCVCR